MTAETKAVQAQPVTGEKQAAENMKISQRLGKLIDVKSIVTFAIVAGITYGFVKGTVDSETYCAFAGTVITYYFTRPAK